jgi:hypothetical protein
VHPQSTGTPNTAMRGAAVRFHLPPVWRLTWSSLTAHRSAPVPASPAGRVPGSPPA